MAHVYNPEEDKHQDKQEVEQLKKENEAMFAFSALLIEKLGGAVTFTPEEIKKLDTAKPISKEKQDDGKVRYYVESN